MKPLLKPLLNCIAGGCFWWPRHYFDHALDSTSILPHAPHPPLPNCHCHNTCSDCG
jgi:hypothetical protein